VTNSEEKFPCTMCGACCSNIGRVVESAETDGIDLNFEFPVNEDGSCGHKIPIMTPEGKINMGCEIYEDRPWICQIELGVPDNMTREQFFRLNAMSCNLMQEEQGIHFSYRVKMPKI